MRAAKSPSAIKTFCFLTEDKWSAADDDTEDNLSDLNQALTVHEEEEDEMHPTSLCIFYLHIPPSHIIHRDLWLVKH